MDNKKEKIPVYFVPGLAAGKEIFNFIDLPKEKYSKHYIEWLQPKSRKEPLKDYVLRMSKKIKHKNPVLIGVSFGGIIAQEIAKIVRVRKVFIISSVKNRSEFPRRLRIIKALKIYRLFPAKAFKNINIFNQFAFGKAMSKKAVLYNKYLNVRDETYLRWAIRSVLSWNQKYTSDNIVHIHGSNDPIFPIKYIKNPIVIKGGNHAIILTKSKQISHLIKESINNDSRKN
jgi:pimeloyl-ACP methyl ester carboxylesterase